LDTPNLIILQRLNNNTPLKEKLQSGWLRPKALSQLLKAEDAMTFNKVKKQ